jgi:hypothetical protein
VNAIICNKCKKWVHKRCTGLSGSLNVVDGFECSRCVEGKVYGGIEKDMEIELGG